MNSIPRLPSRNDLPVSPINISDKIKEFYERVLFQCETNFPKHEPGDVSFKSPSSVVFWQGSFEVAPGNFNSVSMCAGLRINEFERMVNCKVIITSFAQPFVRFPAIRYDSCSWFDP
ncbi:hypothetical protein TNCT_580451 [Trichonephila clavata]|uniref:Uncharacterized protein n=1 Tax=Trichonephila clavata TaxID=2740835 RepID=A0A8X6J7H3_TRICU|nr:hypothetical protein TNCT_580451 [Trichonephila clavata]